MKILKIVQKRTNRRKQYDSLCQEVGAVLLFVFLLPYVISCLWGHIGEETEALSVNRKRESVYVDEQYEICLSGNWGTQKISLEEYLIEKLQFLMSYEKDITEDNVFRNEEEALKAQVVLWRTEAYQRIKDDKQAVFTKPIIDRKARADSEQNEAYQKAVHETDGIILTYQEEPIQAAYFAVSNGQTRDAANLWGEDSYPYLRQIECIQDIQARNYQSNVRMKKEKFMQSAYEAFGAESMEQIVWGEMETKEDEAGYVLCVRMQELECEGEKFRYLFGLNSSCFTVEWGETEVVFHVKGVGHGFGMSQYDAGIRAAAGERYDEILKHYFFQAELVKIE